MRVQFLFIIQTTGQAIKSVSHVKQNLNLFQASPVRRVGRFFAMHVYVLGRTVCLLGHQKLAGMSATGYSTVLQKRKGGGVTGYKTK